jgi:cation diffusion facilitator CzcD-associated flavoprotein CzcO
MSESACDVAVIGAGPYGLAAAAHLRAIDGLDVQVHGDPMSFWEQHMPEGMLLRSPYVASHIADPERSLTLDAYGRTNGGPVGAPVPLDRFVSYGRWFQSEAAPDVDRRLVRDVDRNGSGHFRLTLEDGEQTYARSVVVANGIGAYPFVPELFASLPRDVASHSSEERDLGRFAGRTVVVVGGGQSALESAALLHETGANVEVLVRAPRIYYLRRIKRLHRLGPITRVLFAPAEVGPAGLSRLVSAPAWYRRFPRRLQDRFAVRSLRPAGAAWLVDRLRDVPITTGCSVVAVSPTEDGLELSLSDGGSRRADHVLLATGYRVDISRAPFLSRRLLDRISVVNGQPRLSRSFESSVSGLHFVGASSAWSYGPLMRFVAGTEFTAPVLARGVAARLRRG